MSRFKLSRTFDAPRDIVFNCWVDPAHFVKWFGPEGVENRMVFADIRPGGYSIHEEFGHKDLRLFLKNEYEKIEPTDLLVFLISFCDEAGHFARHPYLPLWPDKMRTTVEFADEGKGTRITVFWDPVDATAEQAAFFEESQWMGQAGWNQSFDRLDVTLGGLRTG